MNWDNFFSALSMVGIIVTAILVIAGLSLFVGYLFGAVAAVITSLIVFAVMFSTAIGMGWME